MNKDKDKNKKRKGASGPYAPHRVKWWGWPLLAALVAATIYIATCPEGGPARRMDSGALPVQRDEGAVFGTFYHLTYRAPRSMKSEVDSVLGVAGQSLSPFERTSVISAINNNTSMETDSLFEAVFRLSKTVSRETDGAFDITVAPLVNLWGFGFKNMDNVSRGAVDSLLAFVGFDKVTLADGRVVKEHPETMLDCGAVAKGYSVDLVGRYLESRGVTDYMVEIGGEVRARGHNPRGQPWRVGIIRPDDNPEGGGEIEQTVSVCDRSMATSGNYRNFYMKDGKKYAHTIDPHTGFPAQRDILSSTVVSDDCATADAYATAFMVLGLEKSKAVLERHPELAAFFIHTGSDGGERIWHTPNMAEMLGE